MAIITISRGTFSGGKALAEALGKQLGYPLLSREETLAQAAKTYGISEEEVSSAVADPPPFWEQVPGRRLAYLRCLTAVILEQADKGNLVYHGNAGHFLLGNISHLLRVRVIANMEFRIRGGMEQLKCSREEAAAKIEQVDKSRRKWTQFLYGVQWEDPSLYDVVLNLDRTSIYGACLTVARMAELGDFAITPESHQAQENLLLSSKVWIALAKDERTQGSFVNVVADRGKVTIRGKADSDEITDAIPSVAKEIPGVKQVVSEVGVGADWYW